MREHVWWDIWTNPELLKLTPLPLHHPRTSPPQANPSLPCIIRSVSLSIKRHGKSRQVGGDGKQVQSTIGYTQHLEHKCKWINTYLSQLIWASYSTLFFLKHTLSLSRAVRVCYFCSSGAKDNYEQGLSTGILRIAYEK